MSTIKEVEASITEHKAKIVEIQQNFDVLAREIAEAELKKAKNLDELKEQQFQLRHDVRHEEQTLEYLDGLLIQAKKQDAIQQYRDWLTRYKDISDHRKSLKAQVDELETKLKPIKKEYEDSWQKQSHTGGRVDELRDVLARKYGVDDEQLNAIKAEILNENESKDESD